MWELAYGDAKTIISRGRFIDESTPLLPPIQLVKVHAAGIPLGETIYYRMMCETEAGSCLTSLRYHYHSV